MLFAGTAALSFSMASRSQLDGDAVELLLRGWALAGEGRLVPYGNPLSAGAGGYEPGPATSLLVGLPLLVWRDYRAPIFVITLLHLASWWILDRVLREAASPRERLLFFVLYGLSPWRMFFSGFLWNPNYLYLAGALHLWAAWRQRERRLFWPSAVLAGTLGFAAQLHPSAVILGFATVFLWIRRLVRLHVGGLAAGCLAVALSLLPWAVAACEDPSILPGYGAGAERNAWKTLHNVLRGSFYLSSLPSLAFPTRITLFDFGPALGDAADRLLRPIHYVATEIVFTATVLPCGALLAGAVRRRRPRPRTSRRWLRSYGGCAVGGALVACLAIPTTLMMWQVLVVFHAALLLLVLRLVELRGGRWRRFSRPAVAVLLAGFFWTDLAAAIASPIYRKGGYAAVVAGLDPAHPMVRSLGIAGRVTVRDPRCLSPTRRYRPTWRGGAAAAAPASPSPPDR